MQGLVLDPQKNQQVAYGRGVMRTNRFSVTYRFLGHPTALFVILLFALFLSQCSFADTVLLKNGGELVGSAVEKSDGVEVTTKSGSTLKVTKDQVKKVVVQTPSSKPPSTSAVNPAPTSAHIQTQAPVPKSPTPVQQPIREAYFKRDRPTPPAESIHSPPPPQGNRGARSFHIDNSPKSNKSNDAQAGGTGYWLNTNSKKRHNSRCRWYGDTKSGKACGPDEGVACKICGG